MSVYWGIPYLFIKVAVADVDPVVVTFGRIAVAVLVLLPVALHRKAFRDFGAHRLRVCGLGLVQIGIPFLCISVGEQFVSSSLTSLLIAAEPIAVALLAFRMMPGERVTGVRFAGLGLGLAGVAALVGLDLDGDSRTLLGTVLILAAATCYALGALLVQRRPFAELPRLGVVTVECVAAGAVLLPVAAFRMPDHVPGGKVLGSIAVLGVVCTAVAWITCLALVREVGASRGTVFTYVNPAIAVLLGVAFLDEPLTLMTVLGFLLIVIGSWFATVGALPGRQAEARDGGAAGDSEATAAGERRPAG
jgi:drug/metabolite transporter (DMT)-like permease